MRTLSQLPAPSILDRAIMSVAPAYGAKRYRTRMAFSLMSGQFGGARSNKSSMKAWKTFIGSADTDSLSDLPALRARSRDLCRNNPIAVGAKNTAQNHTVSTGISLRPQVKGELLGLSPEEENAANLRLATLFDMWAASTACDVTMTQNFYQLQGLVFGATFESGDCLALRRRAKKRSIVPLALAIVEADRIDTPAALEARDDVEIRSGVRLDADGAAISYFVLDEHPGENISRELAGYVEVPAYGANSGERMALHVFRRQRPGQTRGIPELAPVIEILKQLDRYTEAEIMSAVVSSFFTVFVKTTDGSGFAPGDKIDGLDLGADDVAMGPGSVVNLAKDEDIVTANPGRANSNFDSFFSAVVRQIGVALGIPYELLIMHFTASYSASRAAVEMAARFFAERRDWLVTTFCQPVYEWWFSDAINAGLIQAPGFFESELIRQAWLGAVWVPPVGMVIDPGKEWDADEKGVNLGVLTLDDVSIKWTGGGDINKATAQRGREHAARAAVKLEPELLNPGANGVPPPPPKPDAPAKGKSDASD